MKKRCVNNSVVRFLRYCVMWSEHRAAVKLLNQMSDRELKDIGINREDIDRMIWLEEDKTMRGRGE